MALHDMNIANQTNPNFRSDLNLALLALANSFASATAPTGANLHAYMTWYDTANGLLKWYNDGADEGSAGFITIAKLDRTNNRWESVGNVLNAATTAGFTLKNASGTTLLTLSNTGVLNVLLPITLNGTPIGTGLQTISIPAASFIPVPSASPTFITQEFATNDVMISGYDFNATVKEKIQFMVGMPKSWDEGTLTASFSWLNAPTVGTGVVVWGVRMLSRGDGDALDVAFGTGQVVTQGIGSTDVLRTTGTTPAVTPSGTTTENDVLIIEVYRDAANASDTYTEDARLVAVRLHYTTDTGDDT